MIQRDRTVANDQTNSLSVRVRSRWFYGLSRASGCFFIDFKMSTLNAIEGYYKVERVLGIQTLERKPLPSFGDQIPLNTWIAALPRFASAIRAAFRINPSFRSLNNFSSSIVVNLHLPRTSFLIKLTSTAHRSGQGFYTPEPDVYAKEQIKPTFSGGSIKRVRAVA